MSAVSTWPGHRAGTAELLRGSAEIIGAGIKLGKVCLLGHWNHWTSSLFILCSKVKKLHGSSFSSPAEQALLLMASIFAAGSAQEDKTEWQNARSGDKSCPVNHAKTTSKNIHHIPNILQDACRRHLDSCLWLFGAASPFAVWAQELCQCNLSWKSFVDFVSERGKFMLYYCFSPSFSRLGPEVHTDAPKD